MENNHLTWGDVLDVIRDGKQSIPTAPNGMPLVAINAPFYELMQLMAAMAAGYNTNVQRSNDYEKKIEQLRKLARAHFPAERHENEPARWISVEDALPERSGEYFTCGSNCGVYPLTYSAKHHLWNAYDHNSPEDAAKYAISGITHWFPRPAAPAVKEEE